MLGSKIKQLSHRKSKRNKDQPHSPLLSVFPDCLFFLFCFLKCSSLWFWYTNSMPDKIKELIVYSHSELCFNGVIFFPFYGCYSWLCLLFLIYYLMLVDCGSGKSRSCPLRSVCALDCSPARLK